MTSSHTGLIRWVLIGVASNRRNRCMPIPVIPSKLANTLSSQDPLPLHVMYGVRGSGGGARRIDGYPLPDYLNTQDPALQNNELD